MASKEVKNELKSARESIQNKDYNGALKHCKAVLKLDKANYNAFVFVGVASIELGKAEHAQAAYKKAIDINPENILAWQGLASLYEKVPGFGDKEHVVEVYERLMKHYQSVDKYKWFDVGLKLVDLHKLLKNIDEALALLNLLQDSDCEKDQNAVWCKSIALLQENKVALTPDQKSELVNVYRNVLGGDIIASDETRQYFQDYFDLILDNASFCSMQDAILEAKRMNEIFVKDQVALDILAKLYLGQILEVNSDESAIYEELLEVNNASSLAHLGLGKVKLFQKEFTQAEEHLRNGLQYLPISSVGWYLLSQTQLYCHHYEDAFNSSTKGLESLKSGDRLYNEDLVFFHLSLCKAKSSSRLGNEGIAAAIVTLREIATLQANNVDGHVELGRIFVRNNDLEEAKKCLENAHGVEASASRCFILEGEIFAAEGGFESAEKCFRFAIEVQQNVSESYLNLGKLYWKMGGGWRTERDKCLDCLLKAAKSDPNNSSTFLYLGYYYQNVREDNNKALRCYKKAHDLNPVCVEIGEALGDMYMNLGHQEEAAEVCKKFTVRTGIARVKWAFLRLGLYYLKQEQHNDAVQCFQNALRVDSSDANAWECLGEAYMSRGSYSPALASFLRATENALRFEMVSKDKLMSFEEQTEEKGLNPSLLYSQYQIAVVKHLLGLYEEAVVVYKSILAEHCDYVPALKGLGETYISFARSFLHQDFHDRAVDYIQNAIIVLARAVKCDGHLSCLWKLLGDVCSLVFKIHENKVRIELPENLKTFLKLQDTKITKMQVLKLSASSFGQAARYNSSCASLWHDVGLSSFRMSTIHKDPSEKRRLCERSMKALKKGLNMEPVNHIIWNTLGIVAASSDVNDVELSQHSFIMSIRSQKNAVAWTNLGVLYLRHGKADMANLAFNAAQCTDPSYVEAWIGQATIAEMFAHDEAMDLYRHSNELGSHVEGYVGYAHWVCHTLLSIPNGQTSCVVKGKPYADLSHLPRKLRSNILVAAVALNKYTDEIQDDPCAYNMYGILLEHQELHGQAEQAYSRALQLLTSCENPNDVHCNIVRANYARVLCALGKYSESIKMYQDINPLSNFYHITGLALAFLMLGNLQQSYEAYEQAFELATNESQRSHVRAAMGMLGYISGDKDGCKFALCESSKLQPASEQGLLALSVLGMVTSNITLAAAALAELVKIGQTGDESLIAEASYLFASFYALQGIPETGKSYIIQEIHRRPDSSLLWNNLARFMLRFQSNKLKEAGRCAEAAHRLGDRNVQDVSTTLAYSTIGCGQNPVSVKACKTKTSAGVVSAQKAVHMNPDNLANWSLLSAALSDASNSYTGPQKCKHQVCEVLTHFSLTKAIEVSNRALTRPDVFERRNTDIANANQKWLAIQYGYCLYYSGKTDEAIQHCQQALEIWSTDETFAAKIELLLAEITSCHENSDIMGSLEDVGTVLALNQESCYAWLFSARFHEQHDLIKAAEFCYQNCLQLASKERWLHGQIVSLIRLAHLALRQALVHSDSTRWIGLIVEASTEVLKLVPGCSAAILLLGIVHYLQNHIRQGKDTLSLISKAGSSSKDVANFYLVLLNLKKPDKGQKVDDVVQSATRENLANSLQDVLLYFMALSFDGLTRKRLLMKCVHINPSELRFWTALLNM